MRTALILFGVTALGGMGLAGLRLSGMEIPPTWMAILHGILALTSIITLALTASRLTLSTMGNIALTAFVLAAIGGAVMFFGYHLQGEALPIPVMLAHAAAAFTGLFVLIAALSRSHGQQMARR